MFFVEIVFGMWGNGFICCFIERVVGIVSLFWLFLNMNSLMILLKESIEYYSIYGKVVVKILNCM